MRLGEKRQVLKLNPHGWHAVGRVVWAPLALRLTLQIKAATPIRDNPLRTPGPFERGYIYIIAYTSSG
jgi:hypothetical protein